MVTNRVTAQATRDRHNKQHLAEKKIIPAINHIDIIIYIMLMYVR
jgi:hypothetical protein